MFEALKKQGLTDVEFLAITASGLGWSDHSDGYDAASFPVMADTAGVYYMYGASPYNVILIDKKGRLVTKEEQFSEDMADAINKKIRDLHAE